MFRCRILIAILLAVTLPLQSFVRGSCCQRGKESCCSAASEQSNNQAKSCCSRATTGGQPRGCQFCAAAENDNADQPSVDRGSCHCKQNPKECPATEHRRQLIVESSLIPQGSRFIVAKPLVSAPVKVEVTGRSPGLRLHAIHCVWLI